MEETVAQEQNQQVLATILKVGPSAVVDENLVPGTRVLIAKWGGATIPGEENKLLRIINDEDINGFEVEAKKTRAKFRIEFPEIKTYLVYRQPEWKIQVGTYKTKLEADRALLEIKKEFSSAIVVPLGK